MSAAVSNTSIPSSNSSIQAAPQAKMNPAIDPLSLLTKIAFENPQIKDELRNIGRWIIGYDMRFEKELAKTKEELANKKEELAKAKEKLAKSKEDLDTMKTHHNQYTDLAKLVAETIKTGMPGLLVENDAVLKQIEDLKEENRALKTAEKDSHDSNKVLQNELFHLKKENAGLRQEVTGGKAALENKSLAKEVAALKKKVASLQEEKIELSNTFARAATLFMDQTDSV